MSLPPGFVDELNARLSLSQVVGRKVMWDSRKSNQAKGDMWAPCPFHQEKTASFHVDDKKGFYYCFGCHAKGDAISFVRETENVGFMEAVQILAGEAGMQVPSLDPKAKEKSDRRSQLVEVMEMAVRHFRLQLQTAAGASARDYLNSRGLDVATLDRFEIGFAPDTWQGLWDHLKDKGVEDDLILAAGLAKPSNRGSKPYDTFRGRIMFPIRDGRDRAIAFGGRAMDPNDNAKYLNSPETELFDKGRNLYNLGPARAAAGKGQPFIVAEGYMDVIALAKAGFEGAVAPLGTAVTEEQLRLMWRVHPEPVIALDGDEAGQRAANRLIDLSLPMLSPDHALRFVILPQGKDPDDLIRSDGRAAMQDQIDNARPLLSLLWQRETENRVLDSPERKASLDKSLRIALGQIADQSVRNHYSSEVNRLRKELFFSLSPGRRRRSWKTQTIVPMAGTRTSALAQSDDAELQLREAVILGALLVHPELIEEFESDLERVEFSAPDFQAIAGELMRLGSVDELRGKIGENLGPAPLERLFAIPHLAIAPALRQKNDLEMARTCLVEEFSKLATRQGLNKEVMEAVEDLAGVADEGLTWRLGQAAEARNKAEQSRTKDNAEYDIAPSGARMDRDERAAFNELLKRIDSGKES